MYVKWRMTVCVAPSQMADGFMKLAFPWFLS
eukprot:COSAG04_NODE_10742_length_756_cov_1.013699_2_plen_30_part_01